MLHNLPSVHAACTGRTNGRGLGTFQKTELFRKSGRIGEQNTFTLLISVLILSTSQLPSRLAAFPVSCLPDLCVMIVSVTSTACSPPVPPGGRSPMRGRPIGSYRLRPAPPVHLCVPYSRHTDRRRQEPAGEPRRRRRPGQLQPGGARRHSADRPVCSRPHQRIQRRRAAQPAGAC